MNEATKTALEKAAAYVEQTEPKLEKLASLERERVDFNEHAVKTAAILENRGLIKSEKVDEFLNKVAEDPRFALQYLEPLAQNVSNDGMGRAESVKVAADESMDPFEREFGDSNYNN